MFFVTPLKNLYKGVKSIRIILILIALLLLSNCSTHEDPAVQVLNGMLLFFGLLPFLIIWMIFNWDKVEDFTEGPIGKIFSFIIGAIFMSVSMIRGWLWRRFFHIRFYRDDKIDL